MYVHEWLYTSSTNENWILLHPCIKLPKCISDHRMKALNSFFYGIQLPPEMCVLLQEYIFFCVHCVHFSLFLYYAENKHPSWNGQNSYLVINTYIEGNALGDLFFSLKASLFQKTFMSCFMSFYYTIIELYIECIDFLPLEKSILFSLTTTTWQRENFNFHMLVSHLLEFTKFYVRLKALWSQNSTETVCKWPLKVSSGTCTPWAFIHVLWELEEGRGALIRATPKDTLIKASGALIMTHFQCYSPGCMNIFTSRIISL